MLNNNHNNRAKLELKGNELYCQGSWNIYGISSLTPLLWESFVFPPHSTIKIDGSGIKTLDSAGALILQKIILALQKKDIHVELTGFSSQSKELLQLIQNYVGKIGIKVEEKSDTTLMLIGKWGVEIAQQVPIWLTFIGEFFIQLCNTLISPYKLRWISFLRNIEMNGYRALPIIGFLSFLIGVVITYQIGQELRIYGANIYVVNFLGLAIFREFGPLITAIIVAGRTGAAYTAQIGTMKVREEIDALRTMGFFPIELLVIPRILALVISMPLLTLWSDIFGIAGGMIMSNKILGIGYYNFLSRFGENVSLTSFMIGMGKAPVFALLIALVGCFQGMQVGTSAESVGVQTTKSVVLSIFLIIIADAGFSILFSWLNI